MLGAVNGCTRTGHSRHTREHAACAWQSLLVLLAGCKRLQPLLLLLLMMLSLVVFVYLCFCVLCVMLFGPLAESSVSKMVLLSGDR